MEINNIKENKLSEREQEIDELYNSNRSNIPKSHKEYINKLKSEGLNPKVIYDIGSCVLSWSKVVKEIFPLAEIYCFEANEDCKFLYDKLGIKYFITLLSDNEKEETYFHSKYIGGNGMYPELNFLSTGVQETKKIISRTIDDIVKEFNLPLPDLVKIDVQGAELQVIRGGIKSFKDTIIIAEFQRCTYNIEAVDVNVALPYMKHLGFNCISYLFSDNGADGDYAFTTKDIIIPEPEIKSEKIFVIYENFKSIETSIPSAKFFKLEDCEKWINLYGLNDKNLNVVSLEQDKYTGRILRSDEMTKDMKLELKNNKN